jgi:hypothetical protein
MPSLTETIDNALSAVGSQAEDHLRGLIGEFEALDLADEERVAALATAIAAIASTYHRRHAEVYLEAIRSWAVEIAEALRPRPTLLRHIPDPRATEKSAHRLSSGLDALLEDMRARGLDIRNRLITELAVVARLLGRHDPETIGIALMAVTRALADPAYHAGDAVGVPLRAVAPAAAAEMDLATEPSQGTA